MNIIDPSQNLIIKDLKFLRRYSWMFSVQFKESQAHNSMKWVDGAWDGR